MSEERFTRIDDRFARMEGRLDNMAADISVLQTDVGVLKTDVSVLKTDVSVLKTDVSVLKTDVGVLKTDVKDLKIGQERLEHRLEEFHRHAGVMHEDLVDRIKALGGDDGTRLEMRRTVTEVRSQLAEHTTLDDDAHRFFSTSIKDHDRRLGTLEGRKRR